VSSVGGQKLQDGVEVCIWRGGGGGGYKYRAWAVLRAAMEMLPHGYLLDVSKVNMGLGPNIHQWGCAIDRNYLNAQ
jgi:hypothetical protein